MGVVTGDKGMGRDFAGCVVAVGKDVKGWTDGDYIFGLLFHVVSSFHFYFDTSAEVYSLAKELSVNILPSIQVQTPLPRIPDASLMSKLQRFLWSHLQRLLVWIGSHHRPLLKGESLSEGRLVGRDHG